MAEALKRHFGPAVIHELAGQIGSVWPAFRAKAFVVDALNGFEALELMPRGGHIARALKRHLPEDVEQAIEVLCRSAQERRKPSPDAGGMAAFFYLPHVNFISEHGLDVFEASMRAQHQLTQCFTAEFSIRAFLERHEARTLARLAKWAKDPNVHVRRLVSEGTRPRLPWARRLRRFQADPAPVLRLLEKLKDDPELYVRRSVANNLNDIGKDHPDILLATAAAWMRDADANRRALIRHALRSLVKAGDPKALGILGFGHAAAVKVRSVAIEPARVPVGGKVLVTIVIRNPGKAPADVLADLRVHFVKAGGESRPKVFRLGSMRLPPKGELTLRKTVSLAEMTTRRHYPGRHAVDILMNGRVKPIGEFVAVATADGRRRV